MIQMTASISRGKTAEKHNTRECYKDLKHTPAHIKREKSHENVVFVNRRLDELYEELFGKALHEYNVQQVKKGHSERQIRNYLEKVRADKKLHPMYEFVVQAGNKDNHLSDEESSEIYREWLDDFIKHYHDNFAVKQAIVHLDETTPHMHFEVVPVATGTRGLSVQNSMNRAIKQAGFSDYKEMLGGWDSLLTKALRNHGIERVAGSRELQMGGVDIYTFKRSQAVKNDLVASEARLESLRQAIKEKEMEPTQESFFESAAKLAKNRGIDERKANLERECFELRARAQELTSTIERVRAAIISARAAISRLGERIAELREKIFRFGISVEERAERIETLEEELAMVKPTPAPKYMYTPAVQNRSQNRAIYEPEL